MLNQHHFQSIFSGKQVGILGFGQEGRSSYRWFRKNLPGISLSVCDQNAALRDELSELKADPDTVFHFGPDYLKGLNGVEIILKSPGIPFHLLHHPDMQASISSQTELFIQFFSKQVAGITGTKGKSTTASLLYHILQHAGLPSLLMGNIGIPPLDLFDQVTPATHIVFEMSSHQLEHLHISPHKSVLLNIFEEHLDHYPSYADYQQAKLNIARWQRSEDFFLYNPENSVIRSLLDQTKLHARAILLQHAPKSCDYACFDADDLVVVTGGCRHVLRGVGVNNRLPGRHNRINIAAAAALSILSGVKDEDIVTGISTFKGLPHRLEYAGTFAGIQFYNDSISTIPESTIAAIEALPGTSAVILGGHDRGVDYSKLITFIGKSAVNSIVFTGVAGRRMYGLAQSLKPFNSKQYHYEAHFDEAFHLAAHLCRGKGICLLSPAAASYDSFRNFKERGERFRQLAASLGEPPNV